MNRMDYRKIHGDKLSTKYTKYTNTVEGDFALPAQGRRVVYPQIYRLFHVFCGCLSFDPDPDPDTDTDTDADGGK